MEAEVVFSEQSLDRTFSPIVTRFTASGTLLPCIVLHVQEANSALCITGFMLRLDLFEQHQIKTELNSDL